MQSLMSKIVNLYFRVNGFKEKTTRPDKQKQFLDRCADISSHPFRVKHKELLRSKVTELYWKDMELVLFQAKPDKRNADTCVLYFHGGSYVEQPVVQQWDFMDEIADQTGYDVILPVYWKAPDYSYTDNEGILLSLYGELTRVYDNVILFGDSAGGGLAMGLCQSLKDRGLPYPESIYLSSPMMDATMGNPDIEDVKQKDPHLTVEWLAKAGELWSGSLDAADPHVSPINADLSGLPDVTIYVGTDELFLPDCRKYKDKLEAADVSVHYHEWKHMNHDFVFYPIPEGVRARREIIADLREA